MKNSDFYVDHRELKKCIVCAVVTNFELSPAYSNFRAVKLRHRCSAEYSVKSAPFNYSKLHSIANAICLNVEHGGKLGN